MSKIQKGVTLTTEADSLLQIYLSENPNFNLSKFFNDTLYEFLIQEQPELEEEKTILREIKKEKEAMEETSKKIRVLLARKQLIKIDKEKQDRKAKKQGEMVKRMGVSKFLPQD